MSLNIATERAVLIAAARGSYLANQQATNSQNGSNAVVTPSDEQLIALAPPLGQELQALDAAQLQAQQDAAATNIQQNQSGNTVPGSASNVGNVQNTSDAGNASVVNADSTQNLPKGKVNIVA